MEAERLRCTTSNFRFLLQMLLKVYQKQRKNRKKDNILVIYKFVKISDFKKRRQNS